MFSARSRIARLAAAALLTPLAALTVAGPAAASAPMEPGGRPTVVKLGPATPPIVLSAYGWAMPARVPYPNARSSWIKVRQLACVNHVRVEHWLAPVSASGTWVWVAVERKVKC